MQALSVATRSETREALLEGMVTIFNFIGYVPNTIWFDQMSSVALRTRDERGIVKPTDFIMRFAAIMALILSFAIQTVAMKKGM